VGVIKTSRIRDFVSEHARSKTSLLVWLKVAQAGRWQTFLDVRSAYASVDEVRVNSGKKVVVFNIAGNSFRLVCAIHYNRGIIYVLRFMSHAEYSKEKWKDLL
jgi:mRNA interferase HigB